MIIPEPQPFGYYCHHGNKGALTLLKEYLHSLTLNPNQVIFVGTLDAVLLAGPSDKKKHLCCFRGHGQMTNFGIYCGGLVGLKTTQIH